MRHSLQFACVFTRQKREADRMTKISRQVVMLVSALGLMNWGKPVYSQSDFQISSQRPVESRFSEWRSSSEISSSSTDYQSPRQYQLTSTTEAAIGTRMSVPDSVPPPPFKEIPVTTGDRVKARVSTGQMSADTFASSGALQNVQRWVTEQSIKLQSFMGGGEVKKPEFDLKRMLGSLAIVLGGYFAIVFLSRSFSSTTQPGLPKDVVQVLGRTPLSSKQTLQLVKLGNRLLLLLESAEGIQPLAEVSEPEEVEYIASLCADPRAGRRRQRRPESGKQPFRSLPEVEVGTIPSIPNLGSSAKEVSGESLHQSLTNIVRSLEKAARQNNLSRGTSYEA